MRLQRGPDVRLGCGRIALEQRLRAHHHSRDAIAALRRLLFDESAPPSCSRPRLWQSAHAPSYTVLPCTATALRARSSAASRARRRSSSLRLSSDTVYAAMARTASSLTCERPCTTSTIGPALMECW